MLYNGRGTAEHKGESSVDETRTRRYYGESAACACAGKSGMMEAPAMIELSCPSCGHRLQMPVGFAGKKAVCRQCRHHFVVPDREHDSSVSAPARALEQRAERGNAGPRPVNANAFLQQWIMATVGGVMIAGVPTLLMVLRSLAEDTTGRQFHLRAAGAFLLIGTAVGFLQWLVLKRHAGSGPGWVAATGVAWALGSPAAFFFAFASAAIVGYQEGRGPKITEREYLLALLVIAVISGLLVGLPVGIAQWLVLRRKFEGRLRWVTLNAVMWPFLLILSAGVALAVGLEQGPVFAVPLAVPMGATLAGGLTGLRMVSILRRSVKAARKRNHTEWEANTIRSYAPRILRMCSGAVLP